MLQSALLEQLIQALRCLPGVGPKSAQRMAFHLLERDRKGATHLAQTLEQSMQNIGQCASCRTFTEDELCAICRNPKRQATTLCIVENPLDVIAIENSGSYQGQYFVLMGHLSPLDGIGPKELGLDQLEIRLDEGIVEEIILATNPTVEGEATAHYLSELAASRQIIATRIAHGVPLGGELEYLDGGTLSHAFNGRRRLS